jgi:glutathione S-transferase
MFETGAVLLHLTEKSPALAPEDAAGKAEMTTWLFAALNTIEPPLQHLKMVDVFHRKQEWYAAYRPSAVEIAHKRLGDLAKILDGRDFIAAGRFTTADIAMATVLRIVNHIDLIAQHDAVAAYLARCEARPAFQKALASQLADIAAHAPKG